MRLLLLLPLLVLNAPAFLLNARAFSPEELQLSVEARGVLAHSCTKCHGQQKQKGGLRLDTKEAALKGGDDGAVLSPGKPTESELLRRVTLAKGHEDAMPPKDGPLDARDVETLRKWVAAGAPWPEGETAGVVFQRAPIAPRKPEFPAGTNDLANPVDKFVAGYFRERKMAWPQPVDNRTFLRRAALDLVGLLPTWTGVRGFTGDRAGAVNALLARKDDYAAHWFTMWNDALRNDFTGTGYIDGGRSQISKWLLAALREDLPFDAFVRALIAPPTPESEGFIKGIVWRGSVSAGQTREMQAAQNLSQVFLGLNLKCASCHDSFISDYKLRDSYALAAVFADKPLAIARCDKPTGEECGPGFFWPELGTVRADQGRKERQQELAVLLTKKENGRLARTLVNRLWAACFGRGLVEPVDAMDNPPWSRDLLDWLAWDFAENGWNVKRTLALIATSHTYALPAVAVADVESLGKPSFVFQGPVVRRLSAEQFADAVSRVAAPLYDKTSFAPDAADAGLAKGAAWIWHGKGDAPADNFPVGQRYFRRVAELPPGKVRKAVVVATADNGFSLRVNGRDVMSSTNVELAKHADVTDAVAGAKKLVIAVEANNTKPGAAGLRLALAVSIVGQKAPFIVKTSPDWRTSDAREAGWEKAGFDDRAWTPAVESVPDRLWTKVRDFHLTLDPPSLVRASLVQNDELQGALGRPIRDQVTMSRASQATLLQALTLTNGRTFAATLDKAANAWNTRVSDPRARLTEIYHTALLRDPRPEELAFANSATSDLLWAIVLQPEFQLIR